MAVMFVRRPGPAAAPPGPLPQPAGGQGEGSADPLAPWVTGALSGDDRALQRLLEEVAPAVVGLVRVVLGARSPDVDDVAQEALLAIHDGLERFRGEASFSWYARRIAVRVAVAARRRGPAVRVETLVDEPGADVLANDERIARERRLGALRRLLDELPAGQAESLAMRVVLGCSLVEVAEATGVPVNTVRSRVRLAKEHLKDRITGDSALAALFDVEAWERP